MLASPDRRSFQRANVAADIAACRQMLRQNSMTFFAASLLLPAGVREPASALYAFCRLADDAVDVEAGESSGAKHRAVDQLRDRLRHIYAGAPFDHVADRAFAHVVEQYRIPALLPEALLEGFEWDASGRQYQDISSLHAYAARVAGTVGAMMSLIMGARSPGALARACDLGVAMQLTNISRDVGEDARAGRLYLPLDWMQEAAIDEQAWLAAPHFSPALGKVVGRLLDQADVLYDRVAAGVAMLPAGCRPGINAARFLYAEIGREVERAGMDSVSARAVVPGGRKARLLARALLVAASESASQEHPVMPECRFLVDAVEQNNRYDDLVPVPWWKLQDRATWMIGLFERMEQRDRLERAAR